MYSYINNITPPQHRKVAVYARVSTEQESQLSAFENQLEWYKPILAQHPEWELVKTYADRGITGTSAQKRPQFMQMIHDAGNGNFDLILTREVSRFARNTVDTLQYTRDLKKKNVEVYFINDNIKTFDGDGELRLTIMATLAQDESRKMSIRIKSGQQTAMDRGTFFQSGIIMGYDRVEEYVIDEHTQRRKKIIKMKINEEQAKTVRMIYDWYLQGNGVRTIKFLLEKAQRPTAKGKKEWHCTCISRILQNSFYCGIIIYHKHFVPDYLEQKKIKNHGEIEFTKVKGEHEPIITEKEFEQVQKILAKRRRDEDSDTYRKRKQKAVRKPADVWTELLECECGHRFNKRIWNKNKNGKTYCYQCYNVALTGTVKTRLKKGLPIDGICRTPMIPEWKLQIMAKYIFNNYIDNSNKIIELALSMIEKHINDKPNTKTEKENQKINENAIQEREVRIAKLTKRLSGLTEMRADREISKETFAEKQKEIQEEIFKLENEISALKPNETINKINQNKKPQNEATIEEKITSLRHYMEKFFHPQENEDIPEEIIQAFVTKIIAHENSFDWYLRFNPEKAPKNHNNNSKETNNKTTRTTSVCEQSYKPHVANVGGSSFVKFQDFTIDSEKAQMYAYNCSKKYRIQDWKNIYITILI